MGFRSQWSPRSSFVATLAVTALAVSYPATGFLLDADAQARPVEGEPAVAEAPTPELAEKPPIEASETVRQVIAAADASGQSVPSVGPTEPRQMQLGSNPCSGSENFCCLNDWQGSVCPDGQRLASCCSDSCCSCGEFFCTSETLCFQ